MAGLILPHRPDAAMTSERAGSSARCHSSLPPGIPKVSLNIWPSDSRRWLVRLILALTRDIFYYYSSILITSPCPRLQLPTRYNQNRCRDMITACQKGVTGDPVALWSPHSTQSSHGRCRRGHSIPPPAASCGCGRAPDGLSSHR